jgi:glyoxylase I family protein
VAANRPAAVEHRIKQPCRRAIRWNPTADVSVASLLQEDFMDRPEQRSPSAAHGRQPTTAPNESIVLSLWGVRYQVEDVARSIDFYTRQLGFHLDQQHVPAFGQVSIGALKLILSGPGASGSRPLPDGREQQPGGWNRVVLQVADLPARIEALTRAGLRFRNRMEVGPGGRQIMLEDPDGNPIELFEPAG